MSGGLRFASIEVMPQKWQEQARGKILPSEPWPRREPETKTKRSKYNAERVTVDGIKFDSKKEAKYFSALKHGVAVGEVIRFHRQVIFDLPGGVTYRCDFQVFSKDGSVHYLDCKGMAPLPMFRMKAKQVKALYGVEIEIV